MQTQNCILDGVILENLWTIPDSWGLDASNVEMDLNFDNVVDMDFLHLRILTMIKLLKWQSHGSVYVNVIRKSNNSANNSSTDKIPFWALCPNWLH